MFTIVDLPLLPFLACVVVMVVLMIYAFFKEKREDPKKVSRHLIWPFLPMISMLVLYRCVHEANARVNEMFIKIVDISFAVVAVLCLIAAGFVGYLSYKRGYADVEKMKLLKPILICWVVWLAICALLLLR